MSRYLQSVLLIVLIVGALGVVLSVYDKIAAGNHWRRIPENLLILVAIFGGSIPMLITIKIIHHKTRHKKFMLGLPAIILIQFIGVVGLGFLKYL